jgi:1-acyl-sn-glycerol-3-phosphate acyltransferase
MSFYKFVLNVFSTFSKVFYKYEVIGEIPDEGNLIIAANHKSNLDPIFIAAAIKNRPVAAIAKKELFENKFLGKILTKLNVIPIDRENPGISTIKNILRAIKNGYVVGIFPEGTRIKEPGFGKAKAGLSMFAIKGKADVIPISIISNYKLFNKVIIYIDKPISFEKYYKEKLTSEDYEKLSEEVLEVIKDNYFKMIGENNEI